MIKKNENNLAIAHSVFLILKSYQLSVKILFCFLMISFAHLAYAGNLVNLTFNNQPAQATLTLIFDEEIHPKLTVSQNPKQLMIDLDATNRLQGLPVQFKGVNLMLGIKTGKTKSAHTRLIVTVNKNIKTTHQIKKINNQYQLVVTLTEKAKPAQKAQPVPQSVSKNKTPVAKADLSQVLNNKKNTQKVASASSKTSKDKSKEKTKAVASDNNDSPKRLDTGSGKIIIAIDAGHGGKDPGAIGKAGNKEKTVVLAISRKLEQLLKQDPMFKPVLTRTGDYYIGVPQRSEIARKQKANVLVSIHADAAPNSEARGASVWVLSNKRANNEMAGWLEKQEKQSELLGGAGDVLAGNEKDKYLSQAVIDLQFGHSQKVGYGSAQEVLRELAKIGKLHKKKPEHASLGVLRSPDIPSLLVEVGFISNTAEERLLTSAAYQDKLANAIYHGLKRYFEAHPVSQISSSSESNPAKSANKLSKNAHNKHKVKKGDTLTKIADKYGVKASEIKKANKMKDDNVMLDQTLIIPN